MKRLIKFNIILFCILIGLYTNGNANGQKSSIGVDVNGEIVDDGEYLHGQGIEASNRDDYESALAFFRASVRVNNNNAYYWNDLGVTEMRLGLLQKAKTRFISALNVDNNFNIANENLEELSKYMTQNEYNVGLRDSYPILHNILEFPQVDIKELNIKYINNTNNIKRNDTILNQPFIIRNFTQYNWYGNHSTGELVPGVNKGINIEELIKQFGNEKVDFYPHNMIEEQAHPYTHILKPAVEQLSLPEGVYIGVDASKPGTYIQWNLDYNNWEKLLNSIGATNIPPLLDDNDWQEYCFPTNDDRSKFYIDTHWKMLLIGETDAGMFNHKDSLRTSSWQIQLNGRKKWHICAPSEDKYMYETGNINGFEPDYENYPLLRDANCYIVTVNPGDLIYYPKDYWHQTINLDTPTISLSGTTISSDNHKSVQKELESECKGINRTFQKDKKLCKQLNNCYEKWNNWYEEIDNSEIILKIDIPRKNDKI